MSNKSERQGIEGLPSPHELAGNGHGGSQEDPREALLRDLESSRLSAELKAQILTELPPPEERAQWYRELQESGGISSAEFLAFLEREGESQP